MPAQLPVSYRAGFSDHTRLDSLTIKEHTTCINIYIQTYFITDITFEDTVMPCSFLAGYPAAIYNHLRAHHALCLSYWSSYSFNLSALAQFTVQTQHSWQMHEEPTLFLLLWVRETRAFPANFWLPFQVPSRAFSEAHCRLAIGMPLLFLELPACGDTVRDIH